MESKTPFRFPCFVKDRNESGRDIYGTFICQGKTWKYHLWFRPTDRLAKYPYWISFVEENTNFEDDRSYFHITDSDKNRDFIKKILSNTFCRDDKINMLLADREYYNRMHLLIKAFSQQIKFNV